MDLTTYPREVLQRFEELLSSENLKLPPPIFTGMGGEIIDLNLDQKTLTARFPVKNEYQNPQGFMQGGMIAAAIDNTIGALSFIVAPPNVTQSLELRYLHPVPESMPYITVSASLAEQSERTFTFQAEVFAPDNEKLTEARAIHVPS